MKIFKLLGKILGIIFLCIMIYKLIKFIFKVLFFPFKLIFRRGK